MCGNTLVPSSNNSCFSFASKVIGKLYYNAPTLHQTFHCLFPSLISSEKTDFDVILRIRVMHETKSEHTFIYWSLAFASARLLRSANFHEDENDWILAGWVAASNYREEATKWFKGGSHTEVRSEVLTNSIRVGYGGIPVIHGGLKCFFFQLPLMGS